MPIRVYTCMFLFLVLSNMYNVSFPVSLQWVKKYNHGEAWEAERIRLQEEYVNAILDYRGVLMDVVLDSGLLNQPECVRSQ